MSAFAYGTCRASTLSFQRTYNTDMGCGDVNAPITLKTKSVSTSISAPSPITLHTKVGAYRSDGSTIDYKEHSGFNGISSVSFIWVVAVPASTLHTGIVDANPETVGACKGYHTRMYQ